MFNFISHCGFSPLYLNQINVNFSITKIELEGNKVINFNDNLTNINENQKKQNYSSIKDFRHFVHIFYKNREGILHTKLYNDAILISFKEGEVVLNTNKINDKTFNRTVAKLISTWTGRIWQINSSTSNLGKSLYEEDIINQQKKIELMKNNIHIKKILNEFPKSRIHSITELTDVNVNEDVINSNIKKEK